MTDQFDLVVLGAGPGGYVAAIRAAQLGLRVAIVEEHSWGGVCLNVGCVPAKSLLRNAEVAQILTDHKDQFGIVGDVRVDYRAAYTRSRTIAADRVKGIHYLMKKNGITQFEGRGTFTDPRQLEVADADGTVTPVGFTKAIIATGATVRTLPGVELSANVQTYESMILADTAPDSVIIIGAGAIGVEFAYLLRNFGTRVTLIEYFDRILPLEDTAVSSLLRRQLKALGVDIVTSAEVTSVVDQGDKVQVTYRVGGKEQTATAAKTLIAVGFTPRIHGFGLERIGVTLTDRGAIAVDGHLRTSVDGIYAIGDVTAKLQLAHVAEAQGMVAAEDAAGRPTNPIEDYRMMPRATFCQPQVASFGLTEKQAQDEGLDITVSTFPFMANAKAHAVGDPTGFVKLIADARYGQLIGAHLIGHDVSELLPQLTLAQRFELTAEELTHNVHTHPTMSEAMQEAFHGLAGHMINL